MTEYCSIIVNELWEPDVHPNVVVDYEIDDGTGNIHDHERPLSRDHLTWLSSPSPRLQVTRPYSDGPDESSSHCQITLQCKPVYNVNITGVWVVSEARTVEVYDARHASYLQTVRGTKDREDSEADNSRVHFMCQCALDNPLEGITVKFLSLGQRESFEIARIKVIVATCSTQNYGNQAASHLTINMDKLRQDVDDMGDTVSDRAKAFLTTLENFQKSKHGTVDDLRHLLLDKNASGSAGQSLVGITTLLSMFTSSPVSNTSSQTTEGSMMNNMLTQMMSSLAVGSEGSGEKKAGGTDGDMYKFLHSVCGQVSQQRAEEHVQAGQGSSEQTEATASERDASVKEAELESRVTAQVEAKIETRLSAAEEHIKEQVDQRMDELETRMTGKLDAIVALLQNSQKPS